MDNERLKKLRETMKSFNKGQKEIVLDFAKNTEDLKVIPTGIKIVDDFIGGGTKQGTFSIWWGGYSVGKTTLALQQIANAQKNGKIVCFINLEKPIDQSRFEQFGINLEELVLANHCKNAEQALTIIRTLCKAKIVDLIVLDSLNAMAPKAELESKSGKERDLEEKNIAELARVMSEFCRKVNPDIYRSKASVVIIGQTRIGGIGTFFTRATLSGGEAIKFYAYNIVFLRKGSKSDAPTKKFKEYFLDEDKIRYRTINEIIGFDVVARIDKTNASNSARENEEIHIPFLNNHGFVDEVWDEGSEIRIDPKATKEERKKIEDYLKEKGLMDKNGNTGKIIPPQGGMGETKPPEPKKPELRELHEGSEVPVKKKRGRGRPKKEKKNG
ncbi:MAG: ATPase domain-containing protein [Candidatus Helarchaeota archaeon]